MKVSQAFPIAGLSHQEAWLQCGGFYKCPKDANSNRLGPLVGYAGTYLDTAGNRKHFVGDAYYNFAVIEELHHVLNSFAQFLAEILKNEFTQPDWVLGAPMGGLALAQRLSEYLDCQYLFAEKKVVKAAKGDEREQSILVFGRHEPRTGTHGLGIEDVFNNFSTTSDLIKLVESRDAIMTGMAGALNRSISASYVHKGRIWPVVPLFHAPTPQYQQDDKEVAEDITRNNIVWSPKKDWPSLMKAMMDAQG